MSEDLTGRRLGHYRIDGVLGRGGMSVMYKATDVRLGRKVALKVIGEHLGDDMEFRERFVDEARNTSAIDHANVVPLYDFGEVDGLLYIAMRLVDGSDLASLISDGPIAPERALALLGQVAEALDTLHDRGLVHLDLKPANVLVTSRETTSEHVYLADFGLTRRGATGHRTRTGDFLGSPTYAAPEHLRGEPVDGRADAYSLGCMLFACLTGRPPFQGDVQDVIKGHLNTAPPPVSGVVRLPAAIDEVIRHGMSKDPDARYADCRELIKQAKAALAEVPDPSVPAALVGRPAHGGQPSSGQPSSGQPSGGPTSGGQASGGQPSGGPASGGPASGGQASGGQPSGGQPGPGAHPATPAHPPAQPRGPQPAQPQQPAHAQSAQPRPAQPPPGYPAYPGQHPQPPQYGYPPGPPSGPQPTQPTSGPQPVHPAPQQPGQPPHPGYGPPPEPDPARQHPPAAAFGGAKADRPAWLWPVICGAVAIAAIIVFIVVFLSGDGDSGRNTDSSMPTATGPIVSAPHS